MTLEAALWMQNVDYPARLDRALIAAMYDEGVLDLTMLTVSERGAGANFTVDVGAGQAVVQGDDEPNQGNYYAASTSVENRTVTAGPGSDSRIDLVVLRINDQNAGGPVTDDVTIEVIAGTPAASPAAPATPDSAIALATIGPITNATASITDSLITDVRQVAGRRCKPGTLEWHADGVIPSGWIASGPDYAPADYPALFAHIGVTYGGNGSTTFGTPDASGRVLVGPGGDLAGSVGDTGGATTHSLTAAQLPAHDHSIATHTHAIPSHTHTTPSHTHSINHDHGSVNTSSDGAHTHTEAGTPLLSFTEGASGSSGYWFWSGLQNQATNSAGGHTHSVNLPNFTGTSGSGGSGTTGAWSGNTDSGGPTTTGSIGSGDAHPIVQPYQVVGALAIRT